MKFVSAKRSGRLHLASLGGESSIPLLSEHPSSRLIKALNVGESGAGKTGALASLARAGYALSVLDYDGNLGILARMLEDDKEALSRVRYATLRDKYKILPDGKVQVAPGVNAASRAGQVLNDWTKERPWSDKDVLVLDTLNAFSDAHLNASLATAGRLNQRAEFAQWGEMGDRVLAFIQMICDESEFPANVIVNTHIRYFAGDDDTQTQSRGLPAAKGQQIPNNVARYFGTVILTATQGTGPMTRRFIFTRPQGVIQVKTANPKGVKDKYDLDTGLAELFAALRGESGEGAAPKSSA